MFNIFTRNKNKETALETFQRMSGGQFKQS